MRSNSNSLNKYGYVSDANGLSHQQMGMYDDLGRYGVADEDMMYQKNYGIIGDSLKKITNLTGDTAKSIADYLIKPVSDQVAKQIVVPLGTEIISKIVVPITKKVAEQNQDMIKELTDKLMVRVEDFARLQIEKLKEDVKQEITSIPGKVLEKIKPSSWLPWKAESLDEAYSDTYVPNDIDGFAW